MAKNNKRRLPTKPPPPPTPLYRRLFRRAKLPGWLLVLYWVFATIPDFKSRFDFWVGTLRGPLGGMMTVGAALTNPWFGFVVLVSGVLYLVFVGEPNRRAPQWVPYVGWGAVLIIGFVGAFTLWTAYVSHLFAPERHLTTDQREIIVREARALAPSFRNDGGPLSLDVAAIDTPEANGYSGEIMGSLAAGGISVRTTSDIALAPAPMRALSPEVKGVFFQVRDPAKPPKLSSLLGQILSDAGIQTTYYRNTSFGPDNFRLTIGLP